VAGASGGAPPRQPVTVARITAAHGIRGEVRAYPETDFPERLVAGRAVFVAGRWTRLLGARPHRPPLWLLRLEGVDDRNAAEALRGAELQVEAADLPPLPPGSYYHHQILGLRVVTDEGRELGRVEGIRRTGSNDVYEVGPYLIPATREVVRAIDVAGGRIVVHPLPGLLGP
jgi:16S rRNA processing protein RimM